MDFDLTQAIPLSDVDSDGTDDLDESLTKKPVAYIKAIKQKGFPETSFPIYDGVNLIGRGDKANVLIPLKALSKEHACIEVDGDNIFIYDKGSRNKTRRGKLFLKPSVRYELKDNDQLIFGDVKCEFLINHRQKEAEEDDVGLESDSGSETGSECMLQINSENLVLPSASSSGVIDQEKKATLVEDSDSDTDIEDGLLHTKQADTSNFVPDSQPTLNVSSIPNSPFLATNLSRIDETFNSEVEDDLTNSAATQRYGDAESDNNGLSTAPTQAYTIAEAATQRYGDAESDERDEEVDNNGLATAPTQAYTETEAATQRYGDAKSDATDEEVDNKGLATAPTQAYAEVEAATQRYGDAESDEEVDIPGLATAPTQAYTETEAATQRYGDAESDETDEDVDNKGLATAPTQAYTEAEAATQRYGDAESDEEVDIPGLATAPTQAYTEAEAATQRYGDAESDETDEDVDNKGLATAPTQAYAEAEAATQMYGEEYENGDVTSEGLATAPTLAYDSIEDKESDEEQISSNETEAATQAYGMLDEDESAAPTLAYDTQTEAATQAYGMLDEEDEAAAPTLAYDTETQNYEDNEVATNEDTNSGAKREGITEPGKMATKKSSPVDSDEYTDDQMVFGGNDQTAETQVFGDDETAATQVFGDDETAATQVFGDDETAATQVFGDDQTAATQVFGDDQTAATQVFGDDQTAATQVFGDDQTAETQVFGDDQTAETQVFGGNHQSAATQVQKLHINVTGDTQVPDSQETEECESNLEIESLLGKTPGKSALASPDKKGKVQERKRVAFSSVPEFEPQRKTTRGNVKKSLQKDIKDTEEGSRRSGRSRRQTTKMKDAVDQKKKKGSKSRNAEIAKDDSDAWTVSEDPLGEPQPVEDVCQPGENKMLAVENKMENVEVRLSRWVKESQEEGSDATEKNKEENVINDTARTSSLKSANKKNGLDTVERSKPISDAPNEAMKEVETADETPVMRKGRTSKRVKQVPTSEKKEKGKKNTECLKTETKTQNKPSHLVKKSENKNNQESVESLEIGTAKIDSEPVNTTQNTVAQTTRGRRTQTRNLKDNSLKSENINNQESLEIGTAKNDCEPGNTTQNTVAQTTRGRRTQTRNLKDNSLKSENINNQESLEIGTAKNDCEPGNTTQNTVAQTPRERRTQTRNLKDSSLKSENQESLEIGTAKNDSEPGNTTQITVAQTPRGRRTQTMNLKDSGLKSENINNQESLEIGTAKNDCEPANTTQNTVAQTPRGRRTQTRNLKDSSLKKDQVEETVGDEQVEEKQTTRGRGSKRKILEKEKEESTTSSRVSKRGKAEKSEEIDSQKITKTKPSATCQSSTPSKKAKKNKEEDIPCSPSLNKRTSKSKASKEEEGIPCSPSLSKRTSKSKASKEEEGIPCSPSLSKRTSKSKASKEEEGIPCSPSLSKRTSKSKVSKKEDDIPCSPSLSKRTSKSNASKEEQDVPCSPSLRKRTGDAKPKIMFTGVVDESWEKIVNNLGGELVASIHDCTHLITDKIRRTVKFLCGLAKGAYLIDPKWLEQSKIMKSFVNPDNFIIMDKQFEKQYGFSLKRSHGLATEARLLKDFKVHVTSNVKPDTSQMRDIIQCAGGEFLSRMPTKYEEKLVVVASEEDEARCNSATKAGIPVVSSEFILTGILRQEIDIDQYRLFLEVPSSASKRKPAASAKKGTTSKRRK